jgi:hypothetical protein
MGNDVKYRPIVFLFNWNLFTLFFFIISPYEWNIDFSGYILICFFVIFNLLIFRFGYFYAVKNYFPTSNKLDYLINPKLKKAFKYLLLLKIVWIIPSYNLKLGLQIFDITGLLSRLSFGFVSLGESYGLRQLIEYEKFNFILSLSISLLNSLVFLSFPLAVLFWKNLPLSFKFASVVLVLIDVFYWIGIGTNVGILNIFLSIFILNFKNKNLIKRFKSKKLISTLSFLFLGIYFSSSILDRFYVNHGTTNYLNRSRIVDAVINENSFILSITPDFLHNPLIIASNYLTSGYYHLYLAFQLPFDFTYGFGNNYTTLGISDKILNIDILSLTYVGKLKKFGVDPFMQWHTAYLWYANDFYFLGVSIVMFIHGFLLGKFWISVLLKNNIFGVGLFLLFFYQGIYLIANNHILSFSFYSVIFFIILFYVTKNK